MRINRTAAKSAAYRLLSVAALAVLAVGMQTIAPAFAANPAGRWYTADRDSEVRIAACGGALCGALVWLKEPNDPATGRPKTDRKNNDTSKRNRPLLGVEIVLGLRPNGTPNQWQGKVYNPKDGNTYTGYFTMTGADSAVLKGCALRFICKSQIWTRTK
ncbi:MAG: DUF2147 domain-containing protein [Xanthobacteraceae bacterium]